MPMAPVFSWSQVHKNLGFAFMARQMTQIWGKSAVRSAVTNHKARTLQRLNLLGPWHIPELTEYLACASILKRAGRCCKRDVSEEMQTVREETGQGKIPRGMKQTNEHDGEHCWRSTIRFDSGTAMERICHYNDWMSKLTKNDKIKDIYMQDPSWRGHH